MVKKDNLKQVWDAFVTATESVVSPQNRPFWVLRLTYTVIVSNQSELGRRLELHVSSFGLKFHNGTPRSQ